MKSGHMAKASHGTSTRSRVHCSRGDHADSLKSNKQQYNGLSLDACRATNCLLDYSDILLLEDSMPIKQL